MIYTKLDKRTKRREKENKETKIVLGRPRDLGGGLTKNYWIRIGQMKPVIARRSVTGMTQDILSHRGIGLRSRDEWRERVSRG